MEPVTSQRDEESFFTLQPSCIPFFNADADLGIRKFTITFSNELVTIFNIDIQISILKVTSWLWQQIFL